MCTVCLTRALELKGEGRDGRSTLGSGALGTYKKRPGRFPGREREQGQATCCSLSDLTPVPRATQLKSTTAAVRLPAAEQLGLSARTHARATGGLVRLTWTVEGGNAFKMQALTLTSACTVRRRE